MAFVYLIFVFCGVNIAFIYILFSGSVINKFLFLLVPGSSFEIFKSMKTTKRIFSHHISFTFLIVEICIYYDVI
jgi:hypothetical protein